MLRSTAVCLGLYILAFAGCSSDDKGGGGGSGVDQSKKLSDLTAAEATQLCEAHASSLQSIGDAVCVIFGLATTMDQAACQQAVDSCNSASAGVDGGGGTVDCSNTAAFSGCTATVGEFEDCESATVSHIEGLSCAQAGNVPAAPDCAAALAQKCPNLVPVVPGGGTTDGG